MVSALHGTAGPPAAPAYPPRRGCYNLWSLFVETDRMHISIGSHRSSRSLLVFSEAIASGKGESISLLSEILTIEDAGMQAAGGLLYVCANFIIMSPQAVTNAVQLRTIRVAPFHVERSITVADSSFEWVPEHTAAIVGELVNALRMMEAEAQRRTQVEVSSMQRLMGIFQHQGTALQALTAVKAGDLAIRTPQSTPVPPRRHPTRPHTLPPSMIGFHATQWFL